ncbi:MAG: hypothetical protein AAFV85_04185 [Cyanobacteria bacterium J06634_6]
MAKGAIATAKQQNFTRVIGTSGSIRTLGEAAYLDYHDGDLQSANAEVVPLKHLEEIAEQLVALKASKRDKIDGINAKRSDAIHLGGIVLTPLLKMAEVPELTLCDASRREGLILEYIERHRKILPLSRYKTICVIAKPPSLCKSMAQTGRVTVILPNSPYSCSIKLSSKEPTHRGLPTMNYC